MSIRSLRPGEQVPSWRPRRYKNSKGYFRLRWKVGKGEYVEAYEHRVFDGRVTLAEHIHHVDHDPANNDPANLRPVSASEHRQHHRVHDHDRMVRLYGQGLSTPEVASRMGCDASVVYRALVRAGVRPRSIGEALQLDLDEDTIRSLHESGVRVRRIADVLKVSATAVQNRVDQMALTPHRPGRPTNEETEQANRAIAELGIDH